MEIQGQPQASPKVVAKHHPTLGTFVGVGIVLFVLTGIEFGIIYLEGYRTAILAALGLLSVAKFVLVARYFMHLKFDNRLLTWVFFVGVFLALAIAVAQKFVNLA